MHFAVVGGCYRRIHVVFYAKRHSASPTETLAREKPCSGRGSSATPIAAFLAQEQLSFFLCLLIRGNGRTSLWPLAIIKVFSSSDFGSGQRERERIFPLFVLDSHSKEGRKKNFRFSVPSTVENPRRSNRVFGPFWQSVSQSVTWLRSRSRCSPRARWTTLRRPRTVMILSRKKVTPPTRTMTTTDCFLDSTKVRSIRRGLCTYYSRVSI